jgi:Mrp family chromosome partitioning ATPase
VVTNVAQPDSALNEAVNAALAGVQDPEIRKPITELGMVESVAVDSSGAASVKVLLTVSGCPMREKLTTDVTAAVSAVPGVVSVKLELGVMSDAQRTELRTKLRGDNPVNEIPFAQPGSRTRVYAVASGKGGVGKSSVTVNLAVALAQRGLNVGVLDADIYGFSVPRMLGVTGKPTQVEKMIMPPQAHDVKVISIGMFTPGNTAVVWRGPMLHRALQQFLADVFWGDLDVLLMDLPPGTGDIAISLAPVRRTAGGHHPAARGPRGCRASRLDRPTDAPADHRRDREHELARTAGRLPDGTVRIRWRAGRRGLAGRIHRHQDRPARSGADRGGGPRGWRYRQPGGGHPS